MKINPHSTQSHLQLKAAQGVINQNVDKRLEAKISNDGNKTMIITDKDSGRIVRRIGSNLILEGINKHKGLNVSQKI